MQSITKYMPSWSYEFVAISKDSEKLEYKNLNLIECFLRKVFGCYKETHSKTINNHLEMRVTTVDNFSKNGPVATLIKKIHTFTGVYVLLTNSKILSEKPASIDFRKLPCKKADALPAADTDPNTVFSGTEPLYHAAPNAGVHGKLGMFGDSYLDGEGPVELDRSKVQVEKEKVKEGDKTVEKTKYSVDGGKTWEYSSASGAAQPLPHRKIAFNADDRASYSGDYELSKNGLPVYPYRDIQLDDKQKPDNPQLQLGKLGPNHAGDAEVFRFNPETGALELAVVYRKNENEWALTGGMRDHGEKNLGAAKREFIEEAAEDAKGDRLKYLNDDNNWNFIWHGPNAADFRNTRHGWMETSVNALVLDKEQAPKWEKLKAGDDASRAKWLTIDAKTLNDWFNGTEKLFALHTEYVVMTLLNPAFQKNAIAKAKDNPEQVKQLLGVFVEAARQADKMGLSGFAKA